MIRSARWNLRSAGPLAALRNQAGIVDLASVLVGVLVLSFMAAIAIASVYVIVPWSQDEAANDVLDVARAAEASISVRDGKFRDLDELIADDRIAEIPTLQVKAGDSGSCFVASALSGTGVTYYATSANDTIVNDRDHTVNTAWCVTIPPLGGTE